MRAAPEEARIGNQEATGSDVAAMTKNPLFSIIIPTYNAAHLVGATIDSALAQSFRDFEIIVVDDGSTDGTPEVLRSFGESITVLRQENQGAEAARHNGAARASGEYLALLDHDDLLMDGALAIYARIIHSGEIPAVIIARLCRFQDGEPAPGPMDSDAGIEVLRYPSYFGRDRALAQGCSQLVIRRTVAQTTGALRSKPTAFPYDSSDIFLALGAAGPCIAILQPTTVAYRFHASNNSGDIDNMISTSPRLINAVRQNDYPGDPHHRFARYANLGGMQFALLTRSLRAKRLDLAGRVIWESWPMLLAAVARKVALQFRPRATPAWITPGRIPAPAEGDSYTD